MVLGSGFGASGFTLTAPLRRAIIRAVRHRATTALLIAALVSALASSRAPVLAAAEADMAGGWMVEFGLPWGGSAEYPMWIVQNGARLTGRVTIIGAREYQLKGTIADDRFTIVWQTVLEGEFVDVTFAGRIKGEELAGSAKIGEYAARELYGRRTER